MDEGFAHTTLAEAKVQAFRAPVVDWPIGFRGGPVLLGEDLQRFRHCRAGKPYDHFAEGCRYDDRLAGTYIYAGPLYSHFGHFLSEMAHRILPARALGLTGKYLFILPENALEGLRLDGMPSPIRDILAFLGVTDENSVVINRHSTVEQLHVVEQGCQLNADPPLVYLNLLRRHSSRELDKLFPDVTRPSKLYVSRSALPKPGGILGERHFDSALLQEGFTIFRPERFSFAEQMDHYRKADVVVFAEGSACHGAELLGSGMLKTCVLIPRSQQAPLFRQLLKARSHRFVEATGTYYLGTAVECPATGQPIFHRGVSILLPAELREGLSKAGIASLDHFDTKKYAAHKVADMLSYLRQPIPEGRSIAWRRRAKLIWSALTR